MTIKELKNILDMYPLDAEVKKEAYINQFGEKGFVNIKLSGIKFHKRENVLQIT